MHLRNVCISDKCPSNPRWRRCALILICCEFIFRLDANLPWNELFILRCFPVESVLAYGELHVEKLLYHIVPVVPVPFIHRWLAFGLCKISDVARSFRVYNVFHVSSFSFFLRETGPVDARWKRDCYLQFEMKGSVFSWKVKYQFLRYFFQLFVLSTSRRRTRIKVTQFVLGIRDW